MSDTSPPPLEPDTTLAFVLLCLGVVAVVNATGLVALALRLSS